jgi:capsular exopolysaccharide synthesis family protein
MARTFEALQRAVEEKGLKTEFPPLTTVPENIEISLPSLEEYRRAGNPLPIPVPKPPKLGKLSVMVEEYQRMKYRIINYDPSLVIKSIVFCSPTRGEGASTVLIHFAQTLAAEGNRVLLVDGNLRNPHLHQAFRLPKENGLADLAFSMENFRNIEGCAKETSLENLMVITSGKSHPNPCSILGSDVFGTLNDQLKEKWDWILIDSPPVASCNDSMALACKADGIVLVVQAERTRWEAVQEAQERLKNCGGRVLGVVLNKRRFYIPKWIYKRI